MREANVKEWKMLVMALIILLTFMAVWFWVIASRGFEGYGIF